MVPPGGGVSKRPRGVQAVEQVSGVGECGCGSELVASGSTGGGVASGIGDCRQGSEHVALGSAGGGLAE